MSPPSVETLSGPVHGHTVQRREVDPDPAEHWEHKGSVWGAGTSAGDDVVNGADRRRVQFDAELDQDRDEPLRAPLLESFRGLPDVEYLDFTVRVDGDVMEPARRVAFAGRVETADRFVVVGGGEPSVTEVSTDGHGCPLIVAGGRGNRG